MLMRCHHHPGFIRGALLAAHIAVTAESLHYNLGNLSLGNTTTVGNKCTGNADARNDVACPPGFVPRLHTSGIHLLAVVLSCAPHIASPRRLLPPIAAAFTPARHGPAAGTDAGTCCVRKPAGYCVAAVTRADCDAADSCRWEAGLPPPYRCGAAIEATTANGFLQAGRPPTPFRCAQAGSVTFHEQNRG
eukprot:COSAG01_NODE_1836_length_9084_cov_5.216472_8_plen_190_part_00